MVSPYGKEYKDSLFPKLNQLLREASARGDYKEVQRLARIAEELTRLAKKEQEISQSRDNLLATLENPPESRTDTDEVSARERGNRVRRQYVEGVLLSLGVHLEELTSKKYRTLDKRMVGIAYAKELDLRPSFWFLGLSDEHFDWVILLCESSDKTGAEIAALVLPPDCVKQIWKALSRSKGQVKFHVARAGYMNFELRLPGSQPVNISQYLNAVQPLKQK